MRGQASEFYVLIRRKHQRPPFAASSRGLSSADANNLAFSLLCMCQAGAKTPTQLLNVEKARSVDELKVQVPLERSHPS